MYRMNATTSDNPKYPGFFSRLFQKTPQIAWWQWIFIILTFTFTPAFITYKFSHFDLNLTIIDRRPVIQVVTPETCHDSVQYIRTNSDNKVFTLQCPAGADGKSEVLKNNDIMLSCSCPKSDGK